MHLLIKAIMKKKITGYTFTFRLAKIDNNIFNSYLFLYLFLIQPHEKGWHRWASPRLAKGLRCVILQSERTSREPNLCLSTYPFCIT